MENPAQERVRFGLYEVDLRAGELRKRGMRVRLQEQPFQVLAALLQRPGDIVTREELRQLLWPSDTFVDFDHGLNAAINKVRDALGDTATNPRFVETLARRGYRFIAPIQGAQGGPRSASSSGATEPPATVEHPEEDSTSVLTTRHEVPSGPRPLLRLLFALIQGMYSIFYMAALRNLHATHARVEALAGSLTGVTLFVLVATALAGLAVRLYLLSSVSFDSPGLGRRFERIFPLILLLDWPWALSPLLLSHQIGSGLALAATAGLLYLPFSQRTLILMAYGKNQNDQR